MTAQRQIILSVGDTEFQFDLAAQDMTKYFNAMTNTNKVAPAHNLLMTTVRAEQRDALRPQLANPMLTMQLAGMLLEEYAPDVEIAGKKPSTEPID